MTRLPFRWARRAGLQISLLAMVVCLAAFVFVVMQPTGSDGSGTGTEAHKGSRIEAPGVANTDMDDDGDAPYVDSTQPNLMAQPFQPYPSSLSPRLSRITDENALPGTDEWASIGNYNITSLAAYAGATSVDAGGSIGIHIKSTGATATSRLYRLGYYGGHGARFYGAYGSFATPAQPNCTRDSATGLVQCPWSAALTINTDPGWLSGIYLLRIDSDNGFRFFVYFIVRNDSYASPLIVMEPSKTNQAYNRYGGESLYYSGNNEGRARAYKVSFDRPYQGGAGTGGFFAHEHEMVRWLEASGFDVTYISDVDRAANPNILPGHQAYIVMGHDEYWTWDERTNVENALAAGVNMVFASANESYWNIRLENSANGPNRVIVGYKEASYDPAPAPTPKTITFRDLGRPENALVGTLYQSYYDEEQYNYPWVAAAPASSWYFDCTGFQTGDRVNNIVGDEWDGVEDNGSTPPGIETLAHNTMHNPRGEPLPHDSTMYQAASGARVFAAGSIFFSWGLMDHSWSNQVFQPSYQSQAADPRIQQLTANILDRFTGAWNGGPRSCANQTFYKTDPRPTRTPMPQVPTATGTPPTATRTRTFTATPLGQATSTFTPVPASTNTRTRTPSPIPTSPGASATPNAACSMIYASVDVPKPIPDAGVITSTLPVSGGGTIADIQVTSLTIQHTFAADLSAYIISPQGTRIALFTFVCGNGVWTSANTGFAVARSAGGVMGSVCPPGQGTYRPEEESLNPLVGQSANGVWRLEVSDGGLYDVGTLLGWGLLITYSDPCPIGTPAPSATRTNTPLPTNTSVPTNTPLPTNTRTAGPSATATRTLVVAPSSTSTSATAASATRTGTATRTFTPSRTATTATVTRTPTRTGTPTRTPVGGPASPTPPPVCSMTYISADVPKAVPDQGVVTSTLTVQDVGTIADIRVVNLAIDHTYASDLSVYIISPQGTRVVLFTHVCGSGVWTAANTGFTISRGGAAVLGTTCPPGQGTYLPEEGNLALLPGQPSNGVWRLEVSDGGPYDVGTLRSWGLWIGYGGAVCPLTGSWQETATVAVPSATLTAGLLDVSFGDVPPDGTFYPYVRWMAGRGYVSGYACGGAGEPCPGQYFRPGANVTRGQLLKMAVNATGWHLINPRDPAFSDVPRSGVFFMYIETAYANGVVGGYACGGAGEPCDALNRPYFRPGSHITRGQLSKIIALIQGYGSPDPDLPTFSDVPSTHTFFAYIEAMYANGVIAGYQCGGPNEPCDQMSRPYFRAGMSATRGQVSKLVAISSGGP